MKTRYILLLLATAITLFNSGCGKSTRGATRITTANGGNYDPATNTFLNNCGTGVGATCAQGVACNGPSGIGVYDAYGSCVPTNGLYQQQQYYGQQQYGQPYGQPYCAYPDPYNGFCY